MQETMRIIFGEGPQNVYNLADLLPHRFGPQDLLEDGSHPLLLQEQSHELRFDDGDSLLSHAPASLSPSSMTETLGPGLAITPLSDSHSLRQASGMLPGKLLVLASTSSLDGCGYRLHFSQNLSLTPDISN